MREVQLNHGRVAFVDDEDYGEISKHRWYTTKPKEAHHTCYAWRNGEDGRCPLMHRELMGNPKDAFVDHIDGNGLNNVRSNLRVVSASQNQQGRRKLRQLTSQYKGVCWHKATRAWKAQITVHGTPRYLGIFKVEAEAAMAYDSAARELFGAYAKTNFNGTDHQRPFSAPRTVAAAPTRPGNNRPGFICPNCNHMVCPHCGGLVQVQAPHS